MVAVVASGPGRPSKYCSAECGRAFAAEKKAIDADLKALLAVAEQYGPVRLHTDDTTRPTSAEIGVVRAALAACRDECGRDGSQVAATSGTRLVDESAIHPALVQAEAALALALEVLQRHQHA